MVKDHSDSERGLLFLISSKGSFICTIPPHHSLCYTSGGALAGTRTSSVDPPWSNLSSTTELHLIPYWKEWNDYTFFISNLLASDTWLANTQITREETHCCYFTGYSFWLAARYLLYAPSHRQDSTYHSLCYTSCKTLAETRNISMNPSWRIDPITHSTMSKTIYHWTTSDSQIIFG